MLENHLRVRFNLVYARTNPSIWVSEVKKQAHVDTEEVIFNKEIKTY